MKKYKRIKQLFYAFPLGGTRLGEAERAREREREGAGGEATIEFRVPGIIYGLHN